MPDEGAEGSVFSSRFIGGVRRAWGRFGQSLRAGRRCGAVSGGHCGGFPERSSKLCPRGASRRDRDEPTCEKALSPREYTANVGLSFRNRVAKCRARLDELRWSGGEKAVFVTLTDKMAHRCRVLAVGKVFATDEVKIKT